MKPFYGTPHWSAKAIFSGYLGWFSGDASELSTLPTKERAVRLLALAGGKDNALHQMEKCFENVEGAQSNSVNSSFDIQWALEIATAVLRVFPQDSKATILRTKCLISLGERETSANGRNYFMVRIGLLTFPLAHL